MADNENEFEGSEDLLQEYLDESPKLSPEQLAQTAKAFGLPVSEVRNIARGMVNARKEAAKGVEEGDVIAASSSAGVLELPSYWRVYRDFHLAGQHDQKDHGNWAGVLPTNTKSGLSKEDAVKIRAWAKENGVEVGVRGRIPQSVIDDYDASGAAVKPKITEEERTMAKELKKALAEGEKKNKTAAQRFDSAVAAVGGNLELFGDALNIVDDSWDPASPEHASAVAQHLVDLSKLPPELINRFIDSGGSVIVGNGAITEIDPNLARLKGVQPRGWPKGTSYDDVAGVFNPQTATVVLGNIPGAINTPVSNFAFHEFGHGIDSLEKKISLVSTEDSFAALHSEFKKFASASGHLNNYYVQTATPGAGASEFFADGFRAYMKAQTEPDVELRNAIVRNSFAEAGTFVPTMVADKILKYYDSRIMKRKESTELTRGQKAAATRAKNKSAARNISFAEEARARALRKSGKTYAEISEQLDIPIGTLSGLLGKET